MNIPLDVNKKSLVPAFLRRNLAYQVAAAAAIPALLFLIVLGSFSYLTIKNQALEQLAFSLEQNLATDSNRVQNILESVVSAMRSLSENTMIANGLIDSAGRETYLTPLLEGFKTVNGIPVNVMLADFLGETIAAGGQKSNFTAHKKWIIEAVNSGRSRAIILNDQGRQTVMVAQVIVYSRTSSGEGALVYQLPLDELLTTHSSAAKLRGMKIVAGITRGHSHVWRIADGFDLSKPINIVHLLEVSPVMRPLKLGVQAIFDPKSLLASLDRITNVFVIGGVLSLFIVILLSLWFGRQLTARIRELSKTAHHISTSGSLDFTPETFGEDEVGTLGISIFHMLNRLKEGQSSLEGNVIKLEAAVESANFANRIKTEFLANMSHELRTPLNAIIGFSDALQHKVFGSIANARQLEYVRNIQESGEHLLDLINDILDVSVVESGKMGLHETEFGVDGVIDSALLLVKTRAYERGVLLEALAEEKNFKICADHLRLKQIIVNLLTNAVKFTPDGGRVTVISQISLDGSWGLTVLDTGIGMDAEGLVKALEKFGQVHNNEYDKREGSGLGLPLSLALVEAHGGTMTISSKIDEGTAVKVVFPADRVIFI